MLEIVPKIQVEQKTKKQQEYKLMGTMLLKPGMKLFSWNIRTETLKEVEVAKDKNYDYLAQKTSRNGRVNYTPNCIYIQAINRKNAVKKFNKKIQNLIARQLKKIKK